MSSGEYSHVWGDFECSLLIRVTKEYRVCLDNSGSLDWETTEEYDQGLAARAGYNARKENAILQEAASLESMPTDGIAPSACKVFKRQIGEAVAFNLEQDYVNATQMLLAARNFIRARSEEKSREWYLVATLLTTAPFVLLGLLAWTLRDTVSPAIGVDGLWLGLAFCAGTVGALFSVITRSGKLKFDCSAGPKLHSIEGISRVLAGGIAGVLVALAIRADVILAGLTRNGHLHLVMIFGALIAGAAERLATSIISKFEAPHIAVPSDDTHGNKPKETL
jgi:hypothetical protein